MSEETSGRDRPRDEGAPGPNPFSRQGADAWSFPRPSLDPGNLSSPASGPPAEPAPRAAPASVQPPSAYPHPAYPSPGIGPVPWSLTGQDHPQANAALVTGIVGLVLGLAFGIGGLVGIVGVVLGRRVQRAIDGDPARWTGRGKAHAGVVTGVMGLVALVLWVALFLAVALLSR